MNLELKNQVGKQSDMEAATEPLDAQLQEALRDFRLTMHAWSDAELSRPRTVAARQSGMMRSRAWRLALGWSLSAVLVAAGVTGGGFYQHRREQVKIAQARQAEQQRLAAAQRAQQEEEDLLAKVDSEVSRQVPTSMEPLARLMDEDEPR